LPLTHSPTLIGVLPRPLQPLFALLSIHAGPLLRWRRDPTTFTTETCVTEYLFITANESMKDVAMSVGIPTAVAPREPYPTCPFVVGDFIAYPAAPSIAFRVTWRLYSHASESKPDRWLIGIEQADHPLAVRE
jgi:hypothetical protein